MYRVFFVLVISLLAKTSICKLQPTESTNQYEDEYEDEYLQSKNITLSNYTDFDENNVNAMFQNCSEFDPRSRRPVIDDGEAVVLNPCKVKESREKSFVPLTNFTSYSGYILHMDQKGENYIHFWFFESEQPSRTEEPLIIFLASGPIVPLMSVFEKYRQENVCWKPQSNVLWLTYVIPSGFSHYHPFNGRIDEANNFIQDTGMDELVNRTLFVIKEFFTIFSDFSKNDIYLAGSYGAGKVIPYLMKLIDEENNSSGMYINLKGALILHGFVDMFYMMDYAKSWLRLGIIDRQTSDNLLNSNELAKASLYADQYSNFLYYITDIIEENMNYGPQRESLVGEAEEEDFQKKITVSTFHDMLHTGTWPYITNVPEILEKWMLPVEQLLPELLTKYKILYCNGQLENVTMYRMTAVFLSRMRWKHTNEWYNTPRRKWLNQKNQVIGYWKTFHNLHHVLIRNVGHSWISAKPEIFRQMFRMFTKENYTSLTRE